MNINLVNNLTSEILRPMPWYEENSVYITADSISPAYYYGGIWEELSGVFLLANGTTFPANSSGGEATHVLTVSETPWHQHAITARQSGSGSGGNCMESIGNAYNSWGYATSAMAGVTGSAPHNNMPPYIAVHIWKKISN